MINELLFVVAVGIDLLFITVASRFGRSGLVLVITVNLVLVATFATKLIETFGLFSNVGNIFYGSLIVASNLIIERYGKKSAYTALWLAFSANILFVMMGQFALRFIGDPASLASNTAISSIFSTAPRIALASIVAFLLVQHLNVWLYSLMKEKTHGRRLWLRHIVSVVLSQALDSVLFFSIAFFAVIPNPVLFEMMTIGFILKTCIGIVATPLLYVAKIITPPVEPDDDLVT